MDHEYYMTIALQEAEFARQENEVPVGAIIVDTNDAVNPKIIAKAHNMREQLNDPTAHAELLAIKKAAKKLNTWRLSTCIVYVTLEPCIMCAGVMHQARIKQCVYGAKDKKAGALGSLYNINTDTRLNHNFIVIDNILQNKCSTILKDFFAVKRKKNKLLL